MSEKLKHSSVEINETKSIAKRDTSFATDSRDQRAIMANCEKSFTNVLKILNDALHNIESNTVFEASMRSLCIQLLSDYAVGTERPVEQSTTQELVGEIIDWLMNDRYLLLFVEENPVKPEEFVSLLGRVGMIVEVSEKAEEQKQKAEEEKRIEALKVIETRRLALIAWASEFGMSRDWVDATFDISQEKVIVHGTLDLSGSRVTYLPDHLYVAKDLLLNNCTSLERLSIGLQVGGNAQLRNCTSLKELTYGMSVRGSLDVSYCSSLTELPPGLRVNGTITADHCESLTTISPSTAVGGRMSLAFCTSLTTLPALHVTNDLNLTDCTSLKLLPTGLSVYGDLYITGCPLIDSIPDIFFVKGTVHYTPTRKLIRAIKKSKNRINFQPIPSLI
jgi:hypothetical protein